MKFPDLRRPLALPLLLAIAASLSSHAPAGAQETADAPPVSLVGFSVTPDGPAADTLCKLQVTIENRGEHVASQFGFSVRINDQELAVYGNQLFMYPVEPGEPATIPLYNFWSTETSRPAPPDGKLRIEVTLTEARWFDISIDEEGVEVWQPVGPVTGLPSAQSRVFEMSR